jgi:hypothetical protein
MEMIFLTYKTDLGDKEALIDSSGENKDVRLSIAPCPNVDVQT